MVFPKLSFTRNAKGPKGGNSSRAVREPDTSFFEAFLEKFKGFPEDRKVAAQILDEVFFDDGCHIFNQGKLAREVWKRMGDLKEKDCNTHVVPPPDVDDLVKTVVLSKGAKGIILGEGSAGEELIIMPVEEKRRLIAQHEDESRETPQGPG